jgi:hypothetical protein
MFMECPYESRFEDDWWEKTMRKSNSIRVLYRTDSMRTARHGKDTAGAGLPPRPYPGSSSEHVRYLESWTISWSRDSIQAQIEGNAGDETPIKVGH